MNKWFVVGLALILFGLTVKGASVEGNFTGNAYQGETLTRTLEVCNDSSQGQMILLKAAEENSEWIILKIGQEEKVFSPNECRNVYLFLTPKHFAPAQEYKLKLLAEGNESTTKTFYLQVLEGHTLELSIDEAVQSASQCEEKTFILTLENTGRFNEKVLLSLSGIPKSWHDLSEQEFVLAKGEIIEIPVRIQAPCSQALGSYEFTVKADIIGSEFFTEKNGALELVNNQLNLIDVPAEVKACNDLSTRQRIAIENTGRLADEVRVSLTGPQWAGLEETIAVIQPNEAKELEIVFSESNELPKQLEAELTVESLKFGTAYSKKFLVSLEDCFNLEVREALALKEACLEETPEMVFEVTNTGTREIELKAGIEGIHAFLSNENFSLKPNETMQLSVKIDSSTETAGSTLLALTLDSENFSLRKEMELQLIDCFGLSLEVKEASLCSCIQGKDSIMVSNTGTKTQVVSLTIEPNWVIPELDSFEVQPGESKEIGLLFSPGCKATEKELKATISSEKNLISKTQRISFMETADCFKITVNGLQDEIELTRTEAEMFALKIKNLGVSEQEISISVRGVEWVYFKPAYLTIGPSEEKEVFVYFSPPYDLIEEEATVTIEAKTNYGFRALKDLDLKITGGPAELRIVKTDISVLEAKIEEESEKKQKQLSISITLFNDSNSLIKLLEVSSDSEEFNTEFELTEKEIQPQESASITMLLTLPEEFSDETFFVPLSISTNKGNFLKVVEVTLPQKKTKGQEAPGGFAVLGSMEQTALFVLVALIVLAVGFFSLQGKRSKKKKKPKRKARKNAKQKNKRKVLSRPKK